MEETLGFSCPSGQCFLIGEKINFFYKKSPKMKNFFISISAGFQNTEGHFLTLECV